MRDLTIRRLLALSLLVVAALPVASIKADVEVVKTEFFPRLNGNWCDVRLMGMISTADAAALDATDCKRVNMFISDSEGGDVDAGMRIGRWARKRDAWVNVVSNARCYSSCALVYIGGVRRSNFGVIGLHRPYLAGEPRSVQDVQTVVPHMLDQIREYVEEMGVTPEFANAMISTPPAEIRGYEKDEIYKVVSRTDATYDELEVAAEARNYGVTTEEYRRRHAEAEKLCVADRLGFPRQIRNDGPELAAYSSARYECQQATYWGLSRTVYRTRYSQAVEVCNAGNPTDEDLRECGIRIMNGTDFE